MGAKLPAMSQAAFELGIEAISPELLGPRAVAALYAHYLELARWNERLGLIGPGTADDVMVRHYGEALAALSLIPRSAQRGIDLGSGAGFPGLVLAAARPDLEMTLVEAKERKWSFLVAAARKASLPCRCLNVRVASPLPAGLPESVDLMTVRALKLGTDVLEAFARRLTPGGSMLLWVGARDPVLPRNLLPHASLQLAGGERRRILQVVAAGRPLPKEPAGKRSATVALSGDSTPKDPERSPGLRDERSGKSRLAAWPRDVRRSPAPQDLHHVLLGRAAWAPEPDARSGLAAWRCGSAAGMRGPEKP